ncbi:Major Facilitator Superfamily protein [Candida albicans]|nr:Major Facilitator Superfamily protein [Candida albicans]
MISGGFMAVANCDTVPQFILALAICVGLGNSLNITPLIGVLSHWFNLKRGRAIGMATIGGSVGGIIVPLMLRSLYTKLGLICQESDTVTPKNSLWTNLVQIKDQFEFSALLDPKYSFCIVGTFFTEISLLSMLTYLATYAIAQGMSESQSYVLLTVFNTTGVLGRLVPGILSDKFGHFNIMIAMLIGFTLSMLILWLPFGSNIGALYAFAAISGFFSSSILSLTPVCLGSITPVQKFGQRYGLLYFFVSLGNLFGIQ